MLLRQLPLESRTVKAMGGPHLAWDTQTHLLATVVDILHWANYQRGEGKGPQPKPVPRPGDRPAPRDELRLGTPVPLDELRPILDAWARGGASPSQ